MSRSKNKAGKHHPLTQTPHEVEIPATDRTPAYRAHLYRCGNCKLAKTRREFRRTPCIRAEVGTLKEAQGGWNWG